MDNSLDELYQEIILEHNRTPRNKHSLPPPAKFARGYNPSCGDDLIVFVEVNGGMVNRVAFEGEGCAISQASASLMTDLLAGKSIGEAKKIIDGVCGALNDTDADTVLGDVLAAYGEIAALGGVKKFPMRIKCATLAWHAAKDAIFEEEK